MVLSTNTFGVVLFGGHVQWLACVLLSLWHFLFPCLQIVPLHLIAHQLFSHKYGLLGSWDGCALGGAHLSQIRAVMNDSWGMVYYFHHNSGALCFQIWNGCVHMHACMTKVTPEMDVGLHPLLSSSAVISICCCMYRWHQVAWLTNLCTEIQT